MKSGSFRCKKIAHEIKSALAHIIRKKSDDPRCLMVTITDVDVAGDLSNAIIFITYIQVANQSKDQADIVDLLNQKAGLFRRELAHSVHLRSTPKLIFQYDPVATRTQRLDQLLK